MTTTKAKRKRWFCKKNLASNHVRADLMATLRTLIAERGWTQHEAAIKLSIGQSRVSDLVRGKWEKFSLDMLIMLAARIGKKPHLVLETA